MKDRKTKKLIAEHITTKTAKQISDTRGLLPRKRDENEDLEMELHYQTRNTVGIFKSKPEMSLQADKGDKNADKTQRLHHQTRSPAVGNLRTRPAVSLQPGKGDKNADKIQGQQHRTRSAAAGEGTKAKISHHPEKGNSNQGTTNQQREEQLQEHYQESLGAWLSTGKINTFWGHSNSY